MTAVETLLTAADCAREIGLSVRTLRVYEHKGLLAPRRTAQGWRVYGAAELTRLGEILTLKSLGLSLAQIHEALCTDKADLSGVMAAQQEHLRAQKAATDAMLARLDGLQPRLATGAPLSVDDLITLAKETHAMTVQSQDTAWKRYDQMRPRTAIKMPKALLEDAPGAYHFGGQTYGEINASFRKLTLQLLGQPKVRLFAEGPDQLFAKIVPAQITLTRADTGAVTGLTLHQHGQDIPAERITAEAFAQAKAALKERRANKTPHPDSAAKLRQFLDSQIAGTPNMSLLAAPLAQAVTDQQEMMMAEIETAGSLQDIHFKGVGPDGTDIYTLTFSNETVDCAIMIGEGGLISGFYLGPSL